MRLRLLSYLGFVLGIAFKVDGLPFGARDRRNIEASATDSKTEIPA